MYLSVNFISRKKNPNTRFTALHVDIMKINSVIRFFFQQYIYIYQYRNEQYFEQV